MLVNHGFRALLLKLLVVSRKDGAGNPGRHAARLRGPGVRSAGIPHYQVLFSRQSR